MAAVAARPDAGAVTVLQKEPVAAPDPSTRLRLGAVGLIAAVAAVALLGLALGSRALSLSEVLDALRGEARGDASIIVLDQRLPRTVLGLLVGAALGMGGAVAQSLTRNPLADPGLLGVSSGAALVIAPCSPRACSTPSRSGTTRRRRWGSGFGGRACWPGRPWSC